MLLHADRSHSWSASTMRYGECFVEIQMTYIGSNKSRRRYSNLRIHISSVHVHLPTMLMNEIGYLFYSFFLNPVRARISDHYSRKVRGVLFGLCLEILYTVISIFEGLQYTTLISPHT